MSQWAAWLEGRSARASRVLVTDNPHPKDSRTWFCWRLGWLSSPMPTQAAEGNPGGFTLSAWRRAARHPGPRPR